ncbi:M4 family metallopeptidase [Vitiosangium sp. GDMCC 1.1324]|uniref:M4 family metallopeptidase n=1 Tax=Vitiosangium sp. (strain GDMCC 1.1324) TaxID=2138576 RepID=UPI000D37B7EC|nr:M4 family metallopeptidase [Vitiosangium sp. GDMCC 1.1324]PTL80062.1 peptidase M4 [Vitiosangium sp. GDMCC 1.1324]
MRSRLLAACLSLSLAACGTETPGPTQDESTRLTDSGSTGDIRSALAALPSAEMLGTHDDGIPFMIRGQLASANGPVQGLAASEDHERVGTALAAIAPVFRLRASDLVVRSSTRDEQGHTHIRYAQTRNGLPVFGHELILHVDASGKVYAANGSARDGESVPAPSQAKVSPEAVRRAALESTPGGVRVEGEPRLVYARSTVDQRLKLAYEVVVTGEHLGTPVRDHVFLNALDGSTVQRDSDIHNVRNRLVYSANYTTTVPGTLKRSEGGAPTGDPVVDTAYDNLGIFYDCYKAVFGRDSYNNAGAQLKASVHYGSSYTNAFWSGGVIVCGDGNGTTFGPLCSDVDVVVHEFTHAVTESTSNLTYAGEPGGLNESLSDVFAAFCQSWSTGTWAMSPATWMIGETAYTPGTPGDAMRYLDDPALGGAADYYTTPPPTSIYDLGSISSLAFAMLSKGGTHPRGKSTIAVTGIGIEKAGRIFYYANTTFFTSSTTLAQAKTYTEQAATSLGYTAAEKTSVTQAWQAVGVGVPPPFCTALANGVPVTGLSGAAGSDSCAYPIAIPVGATNLKVEMSGGTGDADLYVKSGAVPTSTVFDCRPYLGGNTETCTFPTPVTGGVYYIVLRGFAAYSGITLKASFTVPAGPYVYPNISGASGASQQLWAYSAPAGATVTVTIAPNAGGSTGNADLYVKFGSAPTSTLYDCRPYLSGSSERCTLTNPTAGTYYIRLNASSAFTGVDLTVN